MDEEKALAIKSALWQYVVSGKYFTQVGLPEPIGAVDWVPLDKLAKELGMDPAKLMYTYGFLSSKLSQKSLDVVTVKASYLFKDGPSLMGADRTEVVWVPMDWVDRVLVARVVGVRGVVLKRFQVCPEMEEFPEHAWSWRFDDSGHLMVSMAYDGSKLPVPRPETVAPFQGLIESISIGDMRPATRDKFEGRMAILGFEHLWEAEVLADGRIEIVWKSTSVVPSCRHAGIPNDYYRKALALVKESVIYMRS